MLEMMESEEPVSVLAAVQEGAGLSMQKTRSVFITVVLFVHGYAASSQTTIWNSIKS